VRGIARGARLGTGPAQRLDLARRDQPQHAGPVALVQQALALSEAELQQGQHLARRGLLGPTLPALQLRIGRGVHPLTQPLQLVLDAAQACVQGRYVLRAPDAVQVVQVQPLAPQQLGRRAGQLVGGAPAAGGGRSPRRTGTGRGWPRCARRPRP
jgi:hypothetical protein